MPAVNPNRQPTVVIQKAKISDTLDFLVIANQAEVYPFIRSLEGEWNSITIESMAKLYPMNLENIKGKVF